MGNTDKLLTLAGTSILIWSIASAPFANAVEGGCSPFEINAGTCVTAGVGSSDVTLGIDVTQPGTPQQPWSANPLPEVPDGVTGSPAPDVCDRPVLDDRCQGFGPGRAAPGGPAAPPTQPISLTDIANFRPSTGITAMEPRGWMVIGLDTNFYSTANPQVLEGTLLGTTASVRFTPIGWRWSYGDETSAAVADGGGSWASLGVPEFSTTSSSHIYESAGSYDIDLAVEYRSEYRFGAGGWVPIPGTLVVPSNRLTAKAGTAATVLVERECTANPRGPGC